MTEIAVTLSFLAAIVLLTLLGSYNGLMDLRQQVRAAWGEIDVQLKRRYEQLTDLVNLLQTTGDAQIAGLSAVKSAKHQAAVAFDPPQLAAAEEALSSAIQTVFAAVDSEPTARVDPRFDQLRKRLIACESAIDDCQRQYNDRVRAYNTAVAGFPSNMTASLFGFPPQPIFGIISPLPTPAGKLDMLSGVQVH